MSKASINIAVIKGGFSGEREVSLRTGDGVARALRTLGHVVNEIDITSDKFDLPVGTEFAFICLHGNFGEDGGIQRVLTKKGVRFNGSGAKGSENSYDKLKAKEILLKAGVSAPKGGLWGGTGYRGLDVPYVLKPISEGSSIGVILVKNDGEREKADIDAAHQKVPILIEEFIQGRECTVGILGDEALPVVEVRPKTGFYDYHNKYTPGATDFVCPADLPSEVFKSVQTEALKAHKALGCEVYSRIDVLLNNKYQPFIIDVNTIPGMTELSLLPRAAAVKGMSYPKLCQKIIDISWDLKRTC